MSRPFIFLLFIHNIITKQPLHTLELFEPKTIKGRYWTAGPSTTTTTIHHC